MTLFGTILTSGVTAVLVGLALWLGRNFIQEWLRGAVKHAYDTKIETLRKDLDLLKQKELSGHQDKLKTYRLVVDVFAEIYSDLHIAFTQGQFEQVRDKYNRYWVRCYGYLSMMAPQDVMDAFDRLNDYILKVLSGRQPPQPWSEIRALALAFINCMRRDIGLIKGDVEYHGEL